MSEQESDALGKSGGQVECAAAQKLLALLATAIESAPNRRPAQSDYLKRLVRALRSGGLTKNSSTGLTPVPSESWMTLFGDREVLRSDALLRAMQQLGAINTWIRALDFYPEPRHRHFTENVWGAFIAGETDALFDSNGEFIALLILIDPDTTYPLHAHRIEELYLVLSGHAEWSHDGENWEVIPPGSIYHNRSYQPHTMRTSDEPLLAMGLYLPPFGWEGGLIEDN